MVKVLQVFKPENPSGVVDKSKPFDYHNKIECSHDSPKLIPKQEEIYKDKPNARPVVCSVKTSHGKLVEHDPLDVFWMGFSRTEASDLSDPSLKSELNWIEKKVAYGASAHARHGKADEFDVHLVALPHMKPVLKMMDGIPTIVGTLGGRQCRMFRVFASSSENMFGLPKVHFVNIHGVDLETGEEIVEKISP